MEEFLLNTDDFVMPGTADIWHGVKTDDGNTNVSQIDLPSNNLTGTLSDELGNLTNLEAPGKNVTSGGSIDFSLIESAWSETTVSANTSPLMVLFWFATIDVKVTDEGGYNEVDVTRAVEDCWMGWSPTMRSPLFATKLT